MSLEAILRHRRALAADWTSDNPVLEDGQFGVETDTLKVKFGDGTTAWNSLGYLYGAALAHAAATVADTSTIDMSISGQQISGDVKANSIDTTLMHATATDVLFGRSTSGAGAGEEIPCTAAGRALLDDAAASNQRTTLGLGTIATQDANNVAITGGSVTGITDLAVADGGTGASSASSARTNLGLVIGTDVQAWDTNLDAYAALHTLAAIQPLGVLHPKLRYATRAVTTDGTAYFCYLGYVPTGGLTINYVRFICGQAGAGSVNFNEVGLFSSPSEPSGSGQTLTKIVATGTLNSNLVTGTGVRRNNSAFAQAISAGTHLWAGYLCSTTSTEPQIAGVLGDHELGFILSLASAAQFTSGTTTWAGGIITDAGSWLGPYLLAHV